MQRLAVAALLISSLLVSGCIGDGTDVSLGGIPEGKAPTGEDAGSPSDHGAPQRAETPVTVDRSDGKWIARQTVTLSNDFGGASSAEVKLSADAGGVAARGWSSGGYKTVVALQVRADSEQDARTWLDRITVTHTDRLSGGRLALVTDVDLPDGAKPDGLSMSGAIVANLPSQPSYTLELDTAAGGATSTALNGPSIDVDVAAGGASVDGAFGRMDVAAAAGGIELVGTANQVSARASAGGIVGHLRAGASGTWTFDVAAGGLDVDIERGAGDAFDVQASVTTGGVSVSLSDGETVSQSSGYVGGSRHVRSRGFDDAAIRVSIDASVTAGGLSIQD